MLLHAQKFRLVAHPAALSVPADSCGGPAPLALYSRPLSATHCAKYSRRQLVGFTAMQGYEGAWMAVTPDPAERAASEGVEVMAGA